LGRRFGKQKRDSGLLILKKLIEKPLYPRDLTRQGFSRNTVNYHLSYYVKYKIAKKLKDGRYAFIDYADGEEAVAEVVEKWKSIAFRSPTPREIADETGLKLEVARDIAYNT
jgi:DNA-binding transcriptional ArsR family regulator